MFDFSIDRNTIKLNGSLTIEHATAFKKLLLESLDVNTSVELDVAEIMEIDLAGFQLLCAAHRSAINNNKSIKFSDRLPDELIITMKSAGFLKNTGAQEKVKENMEKVKSRMKQ